MKYKAFTLLEVLLTIGLISILASIAIVAINPQRQLGNADNQRRQDDLNTIYEAITQYVIVEERFPDGIEAMEVGVDARQEICQMGQNDPSCISLDSALTPRYILSIPFDPRTATEISTRYSIIRNPDGTIVVQAEDPALGQDIAVGVIVEEEEVIVVVAPELQASAVVDGTNTIDISWNINGTPPAIDTYRILYSTGITLNTPEIVDSIANTESSYSLAGLLSGVYQLRVEALSGVDVVLTSNIVSQTVCVEIVCVDHGGADLTISSNQTLEGMHYNIGTLQIDSGQTVTPAVERRLIFYAQNFQGLGNINASTQGYRGGRDGNTSINGIGPGGGGIRSGGGYGGTGGNGSSGIGGIAYGSLERPIDFGSGGGRGNNNSRRGGRGGGAIQLIVAGSAELNGTIEANGETGPTTGAGGGAGGSVWLEVGGTFTGTGTISARGGNASGGGAGGGGGRITFFAGSNAFTGTISVLAGTSNQTGQTDGTIFP